MPITNLAKQKRFDIKVADANKTISRMVGLLGTREPDLQKAVLFQPCSSIHTFAMQYPIDAIFLDKSGCVIQVCENVQPNKVVGVGSGAHAVLEYASGTFQSGDIEIGDLLYIQPNFEYRASFKVLRNLLHWPMNLCIAILWARFIFVSLQQMLTDSGILTAGILIHNTLLFLLFLTRRPSRETSRNVFDWLVAFATLGFAMMLRPHPVSHMGINYLSLFIQVLGMVAIILSLASLGRSFGVVPANRKIKINGMYNLVRHPIYASEVLFYFGFLIGNPAVFNSVFIFLIIPGQLWRSLREESLLSHDVRYHAFKEKVRYRFIPGIF